MPKTILITGATGNIASLVIPQLLKVGANVRAYVRDAEKASSLTDQGVTLCIGDFDNQEALNSAAEGVDAILAITPPNPDAVAQGEAILNAAKNGGSPYYVRISAIGAAEDAPTENGRFHHTSDHALIESGLTYTILRPHFFMQNLFAAVESIKSEGNMYWGMGDGKMGIIDVRDIANCATSLLLNGGHDNKIYTPTGPESIDFHQMAKLIAEPYGKEVNYVPVPIEAVGDAIRELGWGEWGAQMMMDYSKAYAAGWGDFTRDDVKTITGNEPHSFKDFANEIFAPALKA
jgi:uncharacterized protein YbjT (DUF2867 family)